MTELLLPGDDVDVDVDDVDLESVVLGQVSEITGDSGDGGGDRANIVWGLL